LGNTTFYVHIGVYKTGSTSIQNTLFNNREKLLENGINYLSIEPNHSPMFFSLFAREPHEDLRNIMRRMDTPEKAAAFNDAIKRKLRDEFSKNKSPKMVISAEGLSTVYNGAEQLKELLDPHASAYRIIVYVRDPYEYTSSATFQRLKEGLALNDPSRRLAIPEYKSWLWKYVCVFGRQNVDFRIFDSSRFVGGELLPDFLAAIGESPELAKELKIERANEALSHEAGVIFDELNQAIPARIDGAPNPARFLRLDTYLEKIVGEKFSIDPAIYRGHEAKVADNLAWLHEMLGEPVFESSKPRPASVSRWSTATVDSIKRVVGEMAQTIRALRAQEAARQGKISELKHKILARNAIDIPAGLEWLNGAVNPGKWRGRTMPAPVPHFDQTSIRLLACFMHDLALTIRDLSTTDPRDYARAHWLNRLYQVNEENKQN
jgi:hypothetical protein